VEPHPELKTEDLGARIRAVRELTGAGQRDVAKAAGMSRRDLQAAERGVKRLSSDEFDALAGALGVNPDVLTGVGFDPELTRAGSAQERVHPVADHDSARSGQPETGVDLPPTALPDPERRKDFSTRQYIERSWHEVRAEMVDTLASCARLVAAGSGDDIRRLIDQLERDLQELEASQTFQHKLAGHERDLRRVRRPQSESLRDERISTRF
jgi:transcriptional regulator with XRE-family HTH domain